jgi:hypothetical protein
MELQLFSFPSLPSTKSTFLTWIHPELVKITTPDKSPEVGFEKGAVAV